MAKKEKIELTPEERQARELRKKEKSKIFGETFLKSCALFLAVVFVYAMVYIAFGQGSTIYETAPVAGVAGGSAQQVQGGGNTPAAPADDKAVEAAKAINDATKAAENVAYDWSRKCDFTKDVSVGNATDVLNNIIKGVDKNASINSVVGGFIGVGDKQAKIEAGKAQESIGYHGANYKLKATSLKPEDLQDLKVEGDTYTFKLADANTPKKDGSTPLSRLTDDIVVQDEVSSEIQAQVGSAVKVTSLVGVYSNINVKVVITDGKLQEFTYSYDADVQELGLKVAVVGVKGTGAMKATATFSNFVY